MRHSRLSGPLGAPSIHRSKLVCCIFPSTSLMRLMGECQLGEEFLGSMHRGGDQPSFETLFNRLHKTPSRQPYKFLRGFSMVTDCFSELWRKRLVWVEGDDSSLERPDWLAIRKGVLAKKSLSSGEQRSSDGILSYRESRMMDLLVEDEAFLNRCEMQQLKMLCSWNLDFPAMIKAPTTEMPQWTGWQLLSMLLPTAMDFAPASSSFER